MIFPTLAGLGVFFLALLGIHGGEYAWRFATGKAPPNSARTRGARLIKVYRSRPTSELFDDWLVDYADEAGALLRRAREALEEKWCDTCETPLSDRIEDGGCVECKDDVSLVAAIDAHLEGRRDAKQEQAD